jgi:predicted alternative tryptophan synthase beta-subunit
VVSDQVVLTPDELPKKWYDIVPDTQGGSPAEDIPEEARGLCIHAAQSEAALNLAKGECR